MALFLALKLIVTIVPAAPVKLVGVPPPNSIVPAELEKVGSVVHKVKIEPLFESETTLSSPVLKIKLPSAALIGTPPLLTLTTTEKVVPTV